MNKLKSIFSKKSDSPRSESTRASASSKLSRKSLGTSSLNFEDSRAAGVLNVPQSNTTLADPEPSRQNYDDAASYHSIDSISNIGQSNSNYGLETENYNNFSTKTWNANDQAPIHSTDNIIHQPFKYHQAFDNQHNIEETADDEILPPSFNRKRNEQKMNHNKQKDKKLSEAEYLKRQKEKGDEYFQKAVLQHEQGDLSSAATYFKRSADLGNPSGLLFFGLCLRHGWGCKPNEKMAFLYLQKAGETVIPDAKSFNPEVSGAAKQELAMAIYELGQSYYHGWGVPKNRKTATHYYKISADLGDPDAQIELASCFEKGDGVKRDTKAAAHYYRLADKQGVHQFGNSWIYKAKYESD